MRRWHTWIIPDVWWLVSRWWFVFLKECYETRLFFQPCDWSILKPYLIIHGTSTAILNWHASTKNQFKTTSCCSSSALRLDIFVAIYLGRPLPLEITLDPFHWTTTCLRFWWSILNGTSEQLLEALPVKMGWGTPEATHLMSNEKGAPGCLGHTGDHATQLYRDYRKPWNGSLLTNQYQGKLDGIFCGLNVLWHVKNTMYRYIYLYI